MTTRPVHPTHDRFFNFDRLPGLMIRVGDREHHALVAIDGFECSGSMCSTTAWGAVTDGSRAIGRDDIVQGTGPSRVQLRDNFMVTPGRSRIRFADNVNAKPGEYLPSVQTNVWVRSEEPTSELQSLM